MHEANAAEPRRLKKRRDFLRAARGKRAGRSAFSLQVTDSLEAVPGVGFTVTKKIGNAPERNRIKRRLREAVRASALAFRPGHDYVLVGRREALSVSFDQLKADLASLSHKLHAQTASSNPAERRRKPQNP